MTFVILQLSDVTDEMVAQCQQNSRDTLRISLDGTKALLKYEGPRPSSLDVVEKQEYVGDQVFSVLNTPEWSSQEV